MSGADSMPENHPRGFSAYLAGPDVFRPDQADVFAERKALLLRYGFRALCPLDNEFPGGLHGRELAHAIYEGNLQMVKDCDLVLANVNSFRGPGVDDGTAFEIGAAAVLGKPIIAYRDDWKPMHERLGDADDEGWKFENFGNAINLMLEISIVAGGGALIRGSFAEAVYAAVAWRARQSHEKPVHI